MASSLKASTTSGAMYSAEPHWKKDGTHTSLLAEETAESSWARKDTIFAAVAHIPSSADTSWLKVLKLKAVWCWQGVGGMQLRD